ncbi:MAG: hypothetical protein ACK2T3_07060, partial [Candidatus Promineifilaceae bacterium]
DGLATEGIVETPRILETVDQQMSDNVRIFSFGVGDDVDTLLLDSLSEQHAGATTYVRPGQQIDEAVSGFYSKVSTPVLADISIDFDNIIVEQMYPQDLPDLFAGTQMIVTGRYREGGPAVITLKGEVNGQEQTFVYEDNSFKRSGGEDFIPRLWATRAIGSLLSQIRLHGEDPELVQSVVNLSIRYGIITPYTSYLIEEDDIFSQTSRNTFFEESMEMFEAPAEVSGADAVSEAAAQSVMREAEVAAAPTFSVVSKEGQVINSDEVMQLVGSKTFVLRDGIWMDTSFDADNQKTQQIGFASDTYFDLISAAPELGQYLALGPQVLVVHQGQAYEIVDGPGQDNVTMPDTKPPEPAATIEDRPKDQEKDPADQSKQAIPFCGSALVIPVILAAAVLVLTRKAFPPA